MVIRCISLFTLCVLLATPGQAQLERRGVSGLDAAQGNQPLPLDEAFAWYVSAVSPGRLRVSFDLAPGHYLYRHAFAFSITQQDRETAIAFELPAGLRKTDQFFGDIEAYYDQVSVELELPVVPRPDAVLWIEYQGCADWGFCYPPQRREHPLLTP